MTRDAFPWRPLGSLLVDKGFLTVRELDEALAEQRRTRRLLGQILVARSFLSSFSLSQTLAEQHGVGVRTRGAAALEPKTGRVASDATRRMRSWKQPPSSCGPTSTMSAPRRGTRARSS